jgi:predicted  nucleic acid-binding Zn-ribbon protein
VEKVITLLRDLQKKVEADGHDEAVTYDEFACFCKSSHEEKTRSIEELEASVASLSAEYGQLSAFRAQCQSDIVTLTSEMETLAEEIKNATAEREAEHETFAAKDEEMKASISMIEGAIKSIKGGTGGAGGGQGDAQESAGGVPVRDYGGEEGRETSGAKADTLEAVLQTFRQKHEELIQEEAAAQAAHDGVVQAKNDLIDEKAKAKKTKEELIGTTTAKMGEVQANLGRDAAQLTDDRQYLGELTRSCEAKANEWEQRQGLRAGEFEAITKALTVLESTVSEKVAKTGGGGRAMATGLLAAGAAERPAAGPPARKSSPEVRRVPLAFVQLPYRPDSERSAVASLLTRTASRLGSKQLSALAESVSSDPFAKVKGMVQDLIDRLKQEEVNDANHQTWCVEETTKATRERQYRLRTLDKLEEHQRELEATRAALEDQITNLKAQLKDSRTALSHAQALRDREAAENSRLLSESADGKAAVEDAISVLTSFYDAAAAVEGNETVAAPADAPSAGFDGVSHGSQSESVGIIGMMEVVRDDFERTISETTESEAAAVREFTVLKRELEAGITSKDEALTAAESEHTSTVDDISTGMTEITDGQGLLDAAVKSIVELDASCKAGGTDGGDGSALTAEDRESKRAAEIAALEEALCIFGECPNEETPPLEDETKIDPKNELSPSIAAKLGVTGLKEKLGGFLQKP